MDVTQVPGATPANGQAAARKTARDFEAVFAGQIARLMLESGDVGEFGGGHGEEMFRGVMAEQIGAEMARGSGLGLAPAVMNQILRLQGGQK